MPASWTMLLVDETGRDLGPFATNVGWSRGDRLHRGAGETLEVVDVEWFDDGHDLAGRMTVRRA